MPPQVLKAFGGLKQTKPHACKGIQPCKLKPKAQAEFFLLISDQQEKQNQRHKKIPQNRSIPGSTSLHQVGLSGLQTCLWSGQGNGRKANLSQPSCHMAPEGVLQDSLKSENEFGRVEGVGGARWGALALCKERVMGRIFAFIHKRMSWSDRGLEFSVVGAGN